MSDNELVSLAEAQKRIGFSGDDEGRKLRRELEAREGRLGLEIMTRHKTPNRVNYRVTIALIRQHASDLIETPAEALEREVRGYLAAIDERIDNKVAEQIESRVSPQLEKLREQDARTLALVAELSKRVAKIA